MSCAVDRGHRIHLGEVRARQLLTGDDVQRQDRRQQFLVGEDRIQVGRRDGGEGVVGRGEDRERTVAVQRVDESGFGHGGHEGRQPGLFDAAVAAGSSVMPAKEPSPSAGTARTTGRWAPASAPSPSVDIGASEVIGASVVGRRSSVAIGARSPSELRSGGCVGGRGVVGVAPAGGGDEGERGARCHQFDGSSTVLHHLDSPCGGCSGVGIACSRCEQRPGGSPSEPGGGSLDEDHDLVMPGGTVGEWFGSFVGLDHLRRRRWHER